MKRIIILAIVAALLLPVAALADGGLGMSMETFLDKYNAVSAPLGNPYIKLDKPVSWTQYGGYNVASFNPVNNSSVVLLLLREDTGVAPMLMDTLYSVQIVSRSNDDFIDLVSVTARCAEIFSSKLFNISSGDLRITQVLRYYFENGNKGTDKYAYIVLNDDSTISLQYLETFGMNSFFIGLTEDLQ